MFYRITASAIGVVGLFLTSAFAEPTKDVVVANDPANAVPVIVGNETVPVVVGNDEMSPVPVSPRARIPVSASGEWEGSGLLLPAMILHDLIFYVETTDGLESCQFRMLYREDDSSRALRHFTVGLNESVELHYEAGIDTANLLFGTIVQASDPTRTCRINWAAMGFAEE